MSAKTRLLLGAALALLTLAVAVPWFLAHYEKRPVFVPAPDAARRERHPFTTAAAYLRASGVDARLRWELRFFRRLPEPGALLIVRRLPPEGPLRHRLFDWVAAGGHLVCEAGDALRDDGRDSDLARRLGIRRADFRLPSDAGAVRWLHTASSGRPFRLDVGILAGLRVTPPCRPEWHLRGHVEWRSRLARSLPPLPSRYSDEVCDWALRMPLGRGAVTVLSDLSPLIGTAIGQADNAFLLNELVRGHGTVWLWTPGREGTPGREATLLQRLVRGCPLFLCALALLLLAFLWSRQRRLHPPVPLPVPERRDALAHFTGAGRFAWRVNRAEALIRGNREHLAQLLGRRWGRAEAPSASGRSGANDDAGLLVPRGHPATPHELLRLSRAMARAVRELTGPKRRG